MYVFCIVVNIGKEKQQHKETFNQFIDQNSLFFCTHTTVV